MKMICKAVAFAAAVTTSVTLGGCVTSDYGNKQLGGTLLGAGAGGLVGAQFGSGTGKLNRISRADPHMSAFDLRCSGS